MRESKKVKVGDVIASEVGVVLNGTVKDLEMVEELYTADHEREALEILDRMLGLPRGVDPAIGRLRFLFAEGDLIEPKLHVESIIANLAMIKVETKLGGKFSKYLMMLRSKCFSAIVSQPSGREDADLMGKAIENAEIVLQLFPEDPTFLTLAAQVIFIQGDTNRAVVLVKKALKLDPRSEMAKATLKIINQGHGTEQFTSMTERALMILDEIENAERDVRDMTLASNLLNESLDIFEHQPRAWVGIGFIFAKLNLRKEAVESLKKAQKYDPFDSMVQELANALDKLGWLDEDK